MNRNFCKEMFGGELDITEESEEEKSQARQHGDWLHETHTRKIGMLQNVQGVLKKTESFYRTKENMLFPIRDGIEEALKEMSRYQLSDVNDLLLHFLNVIEIFSSCIAQVATHHRGRARANVANLSINHRKR